MTETREFNAATVEEAVSKASKALGLTEEDLPYEVLDIGSAGFLGIGSRDARISVTVDTDTAVAPADEPDEQPVQESEAAQNHTEEDEEVSEQPLEEEETLTSFTEEPSTKEEQPVASDELLGEVEQFAGSAVEAMGLDARIDVYDAGEFIAVDVTTDETGLFIGQKGETIDALQYLMNVAIYKDQPYVKRITVDSEGYRQRRVEAVQGMAHRMARKAVREHQLIELPPMNTSERRIVHLFLRDNPRVTTSSQGTGDNRRVTVSPTQ